MRRLLTEAEIRLARKLREKDGFTNRKIAYVFCVGKTTIWDAIYRGHKVLHPPAHHNVVKIIELKRLGYTSKEVSDELSIGLEEVNYVYSNNN